MKCSLSSTKYLSRKKIIWKLEHPFCTALASPNILQYLSCSTWIPKYLFNFKLNIHSIGQTLRFFFFSVGSLKEFVSWTNGCFEEKKKELVEQIIKYLRYFTVIYVMQRYIWTDIHHMLTFKEIFKAEKCIWTYPTTCWLSKTFLKRVKVRLLKRTDE